MVLPAIASAQRAPASDSLTHAGQWAAEAVLGPSITGSSLIRFASPGLALLAGVDVSVSHSKAKSSSLGFNPPAYTSSLVDARLGVRSYRHSSEERLRPVVGVGARGGYTKVTLDYHEWRAGVYGELGAVYFVATHVSLGATGEVSALYGKTKQTSGTNSTESTSTSFGASLVRLLASVYF